MNTLRSESRWQRSFGVGQRLRRSYMLPESSEFETNAACMQGSSQYSGPRLTSGLLLLKYRSNHSLTEVMKEFGTSRLRITKHIVLLALGAWQAPLSGRRCLLACRIVAIICLVLSVKLACKWPLMCWNHIRDYALGIDADLVFRKEPSFRNKQTTDNRVAMTARYMCLHHSSATNSCRPGLSIDECILFSRIQVTQEVEALAYLVVSAR
jgi:hypothetical protein